VRDAGGPVPPGAGEAPVPPGAGEAKSDPITTLLANLPPRRGGAPSEARFASTKLLREFFSDTKFRTKSRSL
jgi:hypothetical protein